MKQGQEMESNDEIICSHIEQNINSIQIPFYPRAHSSDYTKTLHIPIFQYGLLTDHSSKMQDRPLLLML